MPARSSKKPLRDKELLFDVITGNLMDAIVLLDADGRKIYASAAIGEIFGYAPDELEDWVFLEQIHPDDMPSLQEGFRMLLHQHTGESIFLYRQKNKQGQYIWLEMKLKKVSQHLIPSAQFIAVIRNVSQRIITEQRDMMQKNLLETAFHHLPFSIVIVDKDNTLVLVNQYTLNLLELPAERSKPKTLYALLPEDAERFARDNVQVWQTGKETIKEDIFQTKDKVYIVLIGRKLIQPLPNGEKFLLLHAIDITERKIAEKETEINRNFIRSIAFAIPDILYVYDLEEKKYPFINNGFEKTLGYSTEQLEEMSSNLIQTLIHPEDAPFLTDMFTEIARGGKDFFEYRYRLKDVSGNYRWFHSRKMAFKKNNAGHLTQILGVAQDIDLHHQAEKGRQISLQELRVLYVEDVLSNQILVEEICKQWEVNLQIAANGNEAIDKLQRHTYDLVLMDIQMPGMDGYEITQAIRSLAMERAQRIPIVALTADISEKNRSDIAMAGMNDYLAKPIQPDALFSILKKYASGSVAIISQGSHQMAGNLPEYADEVSIPSVNFGLFDQLFLKTPGEYVNFLQTYMNELDTYEQDFRKAVLENDYTLFRNTRHKINSAIHHLKAEALKTVLLKMENHLEGTAPSAPPDILITELQTESDKMNEAILEKIKSLK
ncbi:PAS domain S-box protein [Rhodocytophaga rosea]|uniref:PAS domain S-box protein n=1 Tax=Rhodocytophaga rosea TaxID=2704465 RepID=A0A6C0GQI3_9BACT|nr:PAS domain S-box protein [Rhodocytophaga rosea]QHT69770.1 PAS domain S-box protein [Rhodocytophaga rosea]